MKDGDRNTTEGKVLSVCRARLCDGDDDDTRRLLEEWVVCTFSKSFSSGPPHSHFGSLPHSSTAAICSAFSSA